MKNYTDTFGSHIGYLVDKTYYMRIIYVNLDHNYAKDLKNMKVVLETRSNAETLHVYLSLIFMMVLGNFS